jgi:hypothetical protein
VVLLLGEVTLKFIGSQNRFSHERVNRIQAYYAGLAGMNYALEMLRTGAWLPTNCQNLGDCAVPADSNFPSSIVGRTVSIIFCPSGNTCAGILCSPPPNINFCINSTVTYQ